MTLDQLNTQSISQLLPFLQGLYEHSDWIVEQTLERRPFKSFEAFKHAMIQTLKLAGEPAWLKLINAHPELTGKVAIQKTLTAESQSEQQKAGLANCTPEEYETLHLLNKAYLDRFNFPFILAVRGPRGLGLSRQDIIHTLQRRLKNTRDFEVQEALQNIHRIVELRLHEKIGHKSPEGDLIWDWQETLAQYTEAQEPGTKNLTVTYLSQAHKACAQFIAEQMRECGFDEVSQDAVGNVVGRYHGRDPKARYLMTGSHFDTVRNAGKYDGRLGIFCPMACIKTLFSKGIRLPFGVEVVAFAEEEGQRYAATFLASSALAGEFNFEWLGQKDKDGITMREAMLAYGLNADNIALIQRDASQYLGFIEVHIEQGPVLYNQNRPLGLVTSINGSRRFIAHVKGVASHAGTTPMKLRHDAVGAIAELALFMEERALKDADSVATMGMLEVPNGSINVIAAKAHFSMDIRAPNDAQRDAVVEDILNKINAISDRRQVEFELTESLKISAAPCDTQLMKHWQEAIEDLSLEVFSLPSGAGHDAMKIHDIIPQAMLFVRGLNSGISHNPLESTSSDDMQLAYDAMMHFLNRFHPL
jgi:N-carbamoyl-L-amino-acid hydrolase